MKRQREFFHNLVQDLKDLSVEGIENAVPGYWDNHYAAFRPQSGPMQPDRNFSSHTMWLANGEQMNYKLYPNPSRIKRTIKDELGSMSYGSYFPTGPSEIDSMKYSPLPSFKNEFADFKLQPKCNTLRFPIKPAVARHPPGYKSNDIAKHCSFCKKNGERAEVYMSHQLFDHKGVACPVLATCVCPQCGKTGHTLSYCPRPPETQTSIVRLLSEHNKPNPTGVPPSSVPY